MGKVKSPTVKSVHLLQKSKDTWKANSAKKQKKNRDLENNVRDLSRSREKWKQEVKDVTFAKDQEIHLLRQEILEAEKQKEKLNQELTTTAKEDRILNQKLAATAKENRILNQKSQENDQEKLHQVELIETLQQNLIDQKEENKELKKSLKT